MKKKISWIAFVFHSITFSLYAILSFLKMIQMDKVVFLLFLIFGIINTIAFGEIVLKHRNDGKNHKGI